MHGYSAEALLENVLESLAHPFYVIDAGTYEVLMANAAARSHAAEGPSTCYQLIHGRDTRATVKSMPVPCGS